MEELEELEEVGTFEIAQKSQFDFLNLPEQFKCLKNPEFTK